MHVPWSTISKLANTKQVEVFINLPLGMAIQRLLLRHGHLTSKHRLKLDEYFGDPDWYDRVCVTDPGLFEPELRKLSDTGAGC